MKYFFLVTVRLPGGTGEATLNGTVDLAAGATEAMAYDYVMGQARAYLGLAEDDTVSVVFYRFTPNEIAAPQPRSATGGGA